MTDQPILSVRGATKIYRSGDSQVVALDDVWTDVEPGRVLGVVGPSGSGKTTFLMIAGLIELPTRGTVSFLGSRIVGPRTHLATLTDLRRRHIGFVFQKANLIPFLNARENVQIALQLNDVDSKTARARAMALLEELGVSQRSDSFPRQLSGGEQQRVAIARALANRPSVLFADEPTAALDSVRGRQVMTHFRNLATREGVAVVIVTHDLRSVDIFDRVLEMQDGRIVMRWSPNDRASAPFPPVSA